MRAAFFVPLAAVLGLVACGPGFNPAYKVEKSRVIGAYVSVDSDPGRSTPAPGEDATFTLVTGDTGPKLGRTYALVVCRAGASNLDVVLCSDPATFIGLRYVNTLPGATDPKPEPSVTFTVPAEADLAADETEVWVFGAVCNGGVVRDLLADPPEYGTDWDPCESVPDSEPQPYGQLISTRLPIERVPTDTNHIPRISGLTFDEQSWVAVAPDDAEAVGCAGMGYPEIAPGGELHRIVGTATDGDLESYLDPIEGFERVEDLFLRLYITTGSPDVTYDVIDGDDPFAELAWRAPPLEEVDPTGTLARFHLYLEDDRHSSQWVQRAVCVVP